MSEDKKIEISRSFSRKIQVSQYEPAEFFASYKSDCLLKDAEKVSKELYALCKRDVEHSVDKFRENQFELLPDKDTKEIRTKLDHDHRIAGMESSPDEVNKELPF